MSPSAMAWRRANQYGDDTAERAMQRACTYFILGRRHCGGVKNGSYSEGVDNAMEGQR